VGANNRGHRGGNGQYIGKRGGGEEQAGGGRDKSTGEEWTGLMDADTEVWLPLV